MNNEEENEDRFYKVLEDVIDQAFRQSWVNVENKKKAKNKVPPQIYESIEEYKTQTGKRFRMTRDQVSRGLTREQAFKEIWQNP